MMPATTEILADQPAITRRRPRRHWLPALVLLPFVLLMILFQLAPMVWVLVGSFQTPDGWGLDYYREILSSPSTCNRSATRCASPVSPVWRGLPSARSGHALRHSGERVKRVLLAFVTMTGNFSGVPLAFAFIIILGINGAVTLLLKSWGLIDGFNLYSGSGLVLIYTYFQIRSRCCCSTRRSMRCRMSGRRPPHCSARAGSMCGTWRCRC